MTAPAPRSIGLRGTRVTVRPYRPDEVEALWELVNDGRWEGVLEATFVSRDEVRSMVEGSGELRDGALSLAVEAEHRLVGEAEASCYGLPSGTFTIGLALFDPADRGRGWGTEALGLLTDYLFRRLGARRVQGEPRVESEASWRMLERLGWTREGVLRRWYPPEGEGSTGDAHLYAITSDEWETHATSWT
jgi:RimJ/RimL family protein N-acetyltransferase